MADIVFDASAVMAVVNREAGSAVVLERLPGAIISSVNLAEVVTKLAERGFGADFIHAKVEDLRIEVAAFDRESAERTGLLRTTTRHLGLSLADRACLALADMLALPVLTADRAWRDVDIGVDIRLIR